MNAPQKNKKRHHYIPIVYLKGFSDERERIVAYRKDTPNQVLNLRPDEIAFENYYYSQPTPDGGMTHNTLEDFFNKYETEWPQIVGSFRKRENGPALAERLFTFIGMMRARVPAARDMVETLLSNSVLAKMRLMDQLGMLSPKPPGHEDILDQTVCSIDPHKSIYAMKDLVRAVGPILDTMGFEIISGDANNVFVTTDNPVTYFDPDAPNDTLRPYDINPFGNAELYFPLDAYTLVHGHTNLRPEFSKNGFIYRTVRNSHEVKIANRILARFGYKMVFAPKDSYRGLVKKFAAMSPVASTATIDPGMDPIVFPPMVFGPRPTKPKWQKRTDD